MIIIQSTLLEEQYITRSQNPTHKLNLSPAKSDTTGLTAQVPLHSSVSCLIHSDVHSTLVDSLSTRALSRVLAHSVGSSGVSENFAALLRTQVGHAVMALDEHWCAGMALDGGGALSLEPGALIEDTAWDIISTTVLP